MTNVRPLIAIKAGRCLPSVRQTQPTIRSSELTRTKSQMTPKRSSQTPSLVFYISTITRMMVSITLIHL